MTSLGTHNLLDGKAHATPFAQILFFTESMPFYGGVLDTHDVWECPQQRDLHIAVRKGHGWTFEDHYKQSVWGRAGVTPNRGTFYLVDHEAKVVLIDEHRINAAFPPYIRGEGLFRRAKWGLHTRRTLRIIRRFKKKGYTIYAGGDLNTPEGVKGYRGVLHEVGDHFDRLGSTQKFVEVTHLSKLGSDHFRLKGWL